MAKNKYPINQKQITKDASLESLLFDIQVSLGDLSQILQDYIYMNSGSLVYPVHKKRTQDEFYTDFNNVAGCVVSKLEEILNLCPDKKVNDYTILMKLLDENVPNDFSWFHYHLIIIERVLKNFIEQINQWRPDKEKRANTEEDYKNFCIFNIKRIWKRFISWIKLMSKRQSYTGSHTDCYENFYALEGKACFLYEMCYDISLFIYLLYRYKVWEYNGYINNNQIDATKNPFKRYNTMPKMGKSHKTHSRTLLDSCEALINKTFFKDDINAVPIMTSLLRLMIEVRFEEYLGIQTIYTDENHSKIKKVVGSDYFELAELDKYAVLPIPLDAIKRIYSWASEFVHRGVSDYYWIIFFVRQYLLNFILGDVYMEENYYNNLKSKIASLFDITEKTVEWKEPINVKPVSHNRLDSIKAEIKNKGYEKFRELEQKREFEAMEKYMKGSANNQCSSL